MGCPLEFVMSQGACVVKCPTMYTLQVVEGVPSCVAKDSNGATITSFGLTSVAPETDDSLSGTSYINWGPNFVDAYDTFTQDLALANATVGTTTRREQLFNALQAAENARGTPAGEDAYQSARVAYYTLTQGDGWAETERERIAQTKAQPIIDGLVSQYNNLKAKQTEQASTIQVINGLRDKVLTVKDDMAFSVRTFQKQVDNIKNQINIDKKNQVDATKATVSWIEVVLNWMIAIATLVCIFLLLRYFARSRPVRRDYGPYAPFDMWGRPPAAAAPPPPRV